MRQHHHHCGAIASANCNGYSPIADPHTIAPSNGHGNARTDANGIAHTPGHRDNSTTRSRYSPAPRSRPDPRLGLVDRNQAEHEARAKAMWGDSKEQVISYLMIQSNTLLEATELATKLFKDRTSAVRANGIRKIIIGIGLICVPIIALIIFLAIGVIPLKLFAVTIMIGLYGAWLVLNGSLMAVAPKSERGDVADQ